MADNKQNRIHHKTKQLIIRPVAMHKPWAILTAVLVAAVGIYFIISSFAVSGAATLSVSPASSTTALGSNFTITVTENSTDTVNAAQVNLTYPSSTMKFVGIDYSTSGFNTQAQSLPYYTGTIAQSGITITGTGTAFSSSMTGLTITYSDGTTATVTYVSATSLTSSVSKTVAAGSSYNIGTPGTINIASGSTTGVSGSQTVAVITFKANAIGAAQAVDFGCVYNAGTCPDGDAVIRSSDNSAQTLTQIGGTYTITDQTAPTVPTGLTVSSHSVNSIGLSWTASTDNVAVTGYKIYRNGTQIGTSATNSFTSTGLSPNTSYTYTISAYDAVPNNSAQSVGVVGTTDPDTTAPTVPGTPTQTSRTMTSMVIGWTSSTDNVAVTGYKIYRNGTQIGTSATNSYSDSGLTPGTSYTYTISAYDAVPNNSAQSTGASLATLTDSQAPTVPSGLSVTIKAPNSVTFSWTASTDNVAVTGYKIYKNGSATALATVATTSYQAVNLTGSTAYTFQVSALDAAGNESAKSTVLAVTTSNNGDFNGDGHVNIFDLSIFLNHWQQAGSGVPEDLNNDNIVNIFDLSILLSSFGT